MTSHHSDDPPVAGLESGGPETVPAVEERPHKFEYEVVDGYFIQTAPESEHLEFTELLERSFGLIDESPERWHNLKASIKQLQDDAPEGVQYKLLFLGRHGQGWHNHAAIHYGIEKWEEHWAYLYGNGEITWGPDPSLTSLGRSQARAIYECWSKQAPLGAPIKPGEMKWYVSPLIRPGETLEESWGDLLGGRPEVWEDWREIYGGHTCDKRSTKTEIQKRFPDFIIEEGFKENDELWKADDRETDAHMQLRARRAMDRLFGQDGAKETYISVTSHSAIFRNLLAVLHHRPYRFATGEMVPVIVKATKI